jgi:hypothetical protein
MFSAQSKPRLLSEDHPEPSDSKMSSEVLGDLEPIIIVLVRNSSQTVERVLSCIIRHCYQAATNEDIAD